MENNSTCAICGTAYYQCNSCTESKLKPWRSVVDTMNHYKIYLIIADYTNGKISRKNAADLLKNCDISDYLSFVPEIKTAMSEILKPAKKSIQKFDVGNKETALEDINHQ